MSSRRKQKDDDDDNDDNKKNKIKQNAHVKAYKKNLRKEEIKRCRDYTKCEKKQRRESEMKRVRIKQMKRLIHDTLIPC